MDSRKPKLPDRLIVVDGKLVENPAYREAKIKLEAEKISQDEKNQGRRRSQEEIKREVAQQFDQAHPPQGLPIITTENEMMKLQVQMELKISDSNSKAIIDYQNNQVDKFNTAEPLDGGDLLSQLYEKFQSLEVPMGFLQELLKLSEYKHRAIIDNSGSMGQLTDLTYEQATPYLQQQLRPGQRLTRWQEAQNRYHEIIDIIGFIPIKKIEIHFLNKPDDARNKHLGQPLILDQTGKNPEDFIKDAHKQITEFFNRPLFGRTPVAGSTPIMGALREAFISKEPTIHYLFTDGEPSDASNEEVIAFMKDPRYRNAQIHPLNVIVCTQEDLPWLEDLDDNAPRVGVLDDFVSEMREIRRDQGPALPFTRGIWLMCNVLAPICPSLDAIDESVPFEKAFFDKMLGYVIPDYMYDRYLNTFPGRQTWEPIYYLLKNDPNAVGYKISSEIMKDFRLNETRDITTNHVAEYARRLRERNGYTYASSSGQSSASYQAPQPVPYASYGAPPSYVESQQPQAQVSQGGFFAPTPPSSSAPPAPQPYYQAPVPRRG